MRISHSIMAAMTLPVSIFAADNSLGTWKRNVEKTKYSISPPNPITSATAIREASGNGVRVTNNVRRKDGTSSAWSYTAQYDGKEYPVTGSPLFDTVSLKQIDASTIATTLSKKGGKYHTTGRTVIARDGNTMTTSAKGTNEDGKPFYVDGDLRKAVSAALR